MQSTSPTRVLCVEDNEDVGFMLYAVLKREGFDAVVTYTVGDALVLAGREEFDLFVLDAGLGEGSGVELCRALRGAHPDPPVVFYSAAAFEADREEALRAGACAYVTKPAPRSWSRRSNASSLPTEAAGTVIPKLFDSQASSAAAASWGRRTKQSCPFSAR